MLLLPVGNTINATTLTQNLLLIDIVWIYRLHRTICPSLRVCVTLVHYRPTLVQTLGNCVQTATLPLFCLLEGVICFYMAQNDSLYTKKKTTHAHPHTHTHTHTQIHTYTYTHTHTQMPTKSPSALRRPSTVMWRVWNHNTEMNSTTRPLVLLLECFVHNLASQKNFHLINHTATEEKENFTSVCAESPVNRAGWNYSSLQDSRFPVYSISAQVSVILTHLWGWSRLVLLHTLTYQT